MKKLIVLALLIAGQVAALGQTVNIHMKDGSVLRYDASSVDYVNFSAPSNTGGKHEAVDLGLPSGLKWATCNVGATKPEEAGYYLAWGEVEEKVEYSWARYKWSIQGSSSYFSKYEKNGVDYILEPEDDAAHVLWGDSWRMPTYEEMSELFNKCTRKWETQNGVLGMLLTGPNGNTLFMPIHGYKYGKEIRNAETQQKGYYWTATKSKDSAISKARQFCVDYYNNRWSTSDDLRMDGFLIRAVTTE